MRTIKIFLFIFVLSFGLYAGGGSVYSRYGLGDVYFSTSSRTLGMGGLGLGLSDINYLNTINPAAWSNLKLTRFETGVGFFNNKLKDNSTSASENDFYFQGFTIAFPIERELGMSLVSGILPVTNVQYEIRRTLTLGPENYENVYSGEGGISKAFLGLSYKLPFDVAVGASFEYYSGKNDYLSKVEFQDALNTENAQFTSTYRFSGMGWNFGLLSNDLAKEFNSKFISSLRIGINYGIIGDLDTDTLLISKSSVTDTLDQGNVQTKMPQTYGIGVAVVLDQNYLITLDYISQDWKKLKVGGNNPAGLATLNKMSAGFEYNRHASQFSSFWEQLVFRGGLSFEKTQYRIQSNDIKEFAASAGISLPVGAQSSLDFGFQYGFRGTTDSNLLKENFFKADISVSFGELWFFRQER